MLARDPSRQPTHALARRATQHRRSPSANSSGWTDNNRQDQATPSPRHGGLVTRHYEHLRRWSQRRPSPRGQLQWTSPPGSVLSGPVHPHAGAAPPMAVTQTGGRVPYACQNRRTLAAAHGCRRSAGAGGTRRGRGSSEATEMPSASTPATRVRFPSPRPSRHLSGTTIPLRACSSAEPASPVAPAVGSGSTRPRSAGRPGNAPRHDRSGEPREDGANHESADRLVRRRHRCAELPGVRPRASTPTTFVARASCAAGRYVCAGGRG